MVLYLLHLQNGYVVIIQLKTSGNSLLTIRQGTYLGTLEDVSHLDLIGWINMARYKWAEITGREIKFKPATFYLGVADHIARVVEGQGSRSSSKDRARGEGGGGTSEGTRAGEGVKTNEGVEHQRPRSASPRGE